MRARARNRVRLDASECGARTRQAASAAILGDGLLRKTEGDCIWEKKQKTVLYY